jgi:hypothetical protein
MSFLHKNINFNFQSAAAFALLFTETVLSTAVQLFKIHQHFTVPR